MKQLLFVCSGNTCRSPMAEALMKQKIAQSPVLCGCVRVHSAGTNAISGLRMSTNAENALRRFVEEPAFHVARQVSGEMIDEADIILAMSASHINSVCRREPSARRKITTLKAFANNISTEEAGAKYDIADPYCQSPEVYALVAQEIDFAVSAVVARLEREWNEF